MIRLLEENMAEHKGLYERALEGWRKESIESCKAYVDALARKDTGVHLHLERKPEDHTDDFERVIGLLEMSQDDNVELDEDQYQNYVMNDWHWSRNWVASNSKYIG